MDIKTHMIRNSQVKKLLLLKTGLQVLVVWCSMSEEICHPFRQHLEMCTRIRELGSWFGCSLVSAVTNCVCLGGLSSSSTKAPCYRSLQIFRQLLTNLLNLSLFLTL